jgi:hypothetical protein
MRRAAIFGALLLAGCGDEQSLIGGREGRSDQAQTISGDHHQQRAQAENCLRQAAVQQARSPQATVQAAERTFQQCAFIVDAASSSEADSHRHPYKISEGFNLSTYPRLVGEFKQGYRDFAVAEVVRQRTG